MKAEELMIGDWLYNKNIEKNMQVYPTMLSQMFGLTPEATTEDYNFFPVLLTEEILEKNGFVKHAYGFSLQDFKLYGNLPETNIVYFTIKINDKEKRIDHVHELQHALRFCGIEKEIKL